MIYVDSKHLFVVDGSTCAIENRSQTAINSSEKQRMIVL